MGFTLDQFPRTGTWSNKMTCFISYILCVCVCVCVCVWQKAAAGLGKVDYCDNIPNWDYSGPYCSLNGPSSSKSLLYFCNLVVRYLFFEKNKKQNIPP